jgi:PIN domain nuclease of toxin-antitoxin system
METGNMIFLDTHAVVFLHAGETSLFTDTAHYILETEIPAMSPMAVLELDYLYEIGRIAMPSQGIVEDLERDLGLEIIDRSWLAVIRKAQTLRWTRDPFDRIIVAQAMHEGCRLLTRDRSIQEQYEHAFW